jgi:hypothetical protein
MKNCLLNYVVKINVKDVKCAIQSLLQIQANKSIARGVKISDKDKHLRIG